MIDTHCHLTDERLESQLGDVLARAAAAGVRHMITISTELADARKCIELCRGRSNVNCTVGVHPTYIQEDNSQVAAELTELAGDPSVKAIGEIGLDYFWAKEPAQHKRQQEVFIAQLQVTAQCGKPVVIHCREAIADCLAIMKDFGGIRAIFHCFTGTLAEATAVLDAGYWLGFTGVVTFKKSEELRQVARMTPEDRILVETDAPYLTPEPMRKQKINEPAMVVHTARAVAEIRGVSYEEFERITDTNAARFFDL